MNKILLLVCFPLLVCCKQTPADRSAGAKKDSVQLSTARPKGIDSALYSKAFISKLRSGDFKGLKLDGDAVVYEGERFPFPDDLIINRTYDFRGQTNDVSYSLEVKRLNYTTLRYSYRWLHHKKKILLKNTGTADIEPGFVLASEVDEDPETGTAYGANQYTSQQTKNCEAYLRIGNEKDEKGRLRATITFSCPDTTFGDIPVLRTEVK